MNKKIIFSSLICGSLILSACGRAPVMKQMYKDAFGQLPETKLSIAEMIAGGAVFSCVKDNGNGQIKLSYESGKMRIDGLGVFMSDSDEELIENLTELFDGESIYRWNNRTAYVTKAEDYLKERVTVEGGESQKSVLELLSENFERSELPYECRDEQFENDFFVPKAGLDFQVATSSVL